MLSHAIVGHLVGDYLLQNDWQAQGKKQSSWICSVHCVLWSASVMLFAGPAWWRWWVFPVLFLTHFVQDRWGLIRRWMRLAGQDQFAAPPMSPWSLIVVDNTWHLVALWLVARILGA